MTLLKIALSIAALLYAAGLILFFATQRSMLYFLSHVYLGPRAVKRQPATVLSIIAFV